MGVFKALDASVKGTMADQWKEMYYCDSLPRGVLIRKGSKRVGENSANTKGNPNIISDGSIIVVNEGQSAVVVENGKVIEVLDTPGEHIFHSNRSPGIFSKGGVKGILHNVTESFGFGGDLPVRQEVMYLNMKEQMSVPFRVTCPIHFADGNTGLSIDMTARIGGVFSFRIADPLTFYRAIAVGSEQLVMESLRPQMEAEMATVASQAMAKLTSQGVRPSELPSMTEEVGAAIRERMNAEWREKRGFAPDAIAVSSVEILSGGAQTIRDTQRNAILRDPTMAAATLVGAQADAMENAATNHGSQMPMNLFGELPANQKPSLWYCTNCRRFVSTEYCDECGTRRTEG